MKLDLSKLRHPQLRHDDQVRLLVPLAPTPYCKNPVPANTVGTILDFIDEGITNLDAAIAGAKVETAQMPRRYFIKFKGFGGYHTASEFQVEPKESVNA